MPRYSTIWRIFKKEHEHTQQHKGAVGGQWRVRRGSGGKDTSREGLNNPHLGRNAIGCGSKIRFEDLSER